MLEKTLESPLDYKEIQPVQPKGDQSWCSLEGLILKLKLQCFGHLMGRVDSLEKTLMLEKIEGGRKGDDRGWDGWMASLTWWTWVWENSGSWWWTGRPGVLLFTGSQRVGHDWATELNLTEGRFFQEGFFETEFGLDASLLRIYLCIHSFVHLQYPLLTLLSAVLDACPYVIFLDKTCEHEREEIMSCLYSTF